MRNEITPGQRAVVHRAVSWEEALVRRAQDPDLVPICGGTALMVDINFNRSRPASLLDLTAIPEIRDWSLSDEGRTVRIGAGVPYTRIVAELSVHCPALAMAARTVGSPQIRNRGTVAGNLATASPAGDAHPPLLATGARVEVASARGARLVDIDDFFLGPKRSALASDELIRAVLIPVVRGPQQFAKIGPRNAMVIAIVSFAVALDVAAGTVGTGVGSAGPTPFRSPEAEQFAADRFDGRWDTPGPADPGVLREFGRLVAAAASPIDDVRGTADYRRHALSVLAARCLGWAWLERLLEQAA